MVAIKKIIYFNIDIRISLIYYKLYLVVINFELMYIFSYFNIGYPTYLEENICTCLRILFPVYKVLATYHMYSLLS